MLTRKNALPSAIQDRLEDNAASIEEIRFFGGPVAIAKSVWAEASAAVD